MFIEPTITWVPSEFSGYIWLDTKIVFIKDIVRIPAAANNIFGIGNGGVYPDSRKANVVIGLRGYQ